MNIVTIMYRPDHTDYCRGCAMDSTGSEMEYYISESYEESAAAIAPILSLNDTDDRYSYADWEFTIIINGLDEDHGDYDYEGAETIMRLATEKATEITRLHKEKLAEQAAEKSRSEREATEKREKKLLETLQGKWGDM